MDNSLRRFAGSRLPTSVLDVDLPGFARAVTSVLRGQAAAQVFRMQGAPFVRVLGRGFDVALAGASWEKVLELLRDESLTTSVLPADPGLRPVDSSVRLSASTVDSRDPLYARVYGLLRQLFTTKVPT